MACLLLAGCEDRTAADGFGLLCCLGTFWVPTVVYLMTFKETLEADRIDIGVQVLIGFGACALVPLIGAWMVISPRDVWALFHVALWFALYAGGVKVAHVFFLTERRKNREAEKQAEAAEEERQKRAKERAFVERVATLPSVEEMVERLLANLKHACAEEGLVPISANDNLYRKLVSSLYESEIIGPSRSSSAPNAQRYDDIPALVTAFEEPLLKCLMRFRRLIPHTPAPFSVPAYELMSIGDVNKVLGEFTWRSEQDKMLAYAGLRETIVANVRGVSQSQLGKREFESGKRIWPLDYDGNVRGAVYAYFATTSLFPLFTGGVPLPYEDKVRFQHQFIVAPPRSGKTQLIQAQIKADLDRVAAGTAAIIVIDSQGANEGKHPGKERTLIQNLINLKVFAPGQPLDGKLVYIKPSRSLALNLFDIAKNDPRLDQRERDIRTLSAQKMIAYCVSPDTDQQKRMLPFVIRLAMEMQAPTFATLRDILATTKQRDFETSYGQTLDSDSCDTDIRNYFRQTYFSGLRAQTASALLGRVDGILSSSEIFGKMFSSTQNSVRLLDEIEAGKVIVINTDKELLQKDGCEAFGRFFLALLSQATLQRLTDKACFCYIDECHDYMASDENVIDILIQARKQKVGLIAATQYLSNIRLEPLRAALSGVDIRVAGRNAKEAVDLASVMGTTREFIAGQTTGTFAIYVQDVTRDGAVQIRVPGNVMEDMERMGDTEAAKVQAAAFPAPRSAPEQPKTSFKRGEVTDVAPVEPSDISKTKGKSDWGDDVR